MSLERKTPIKLSYSKKKFLQKEVPKLSKNEHHEIFNIITQNADAKYSENSRGVYINLKFLDIDTIERIIKFIKYTKEQKNKLDKSNTIKQTNKLSNNRTSNDSDNVTLSKDIIEKELIRLKEKNNENFVFQNFLDKLSISNIKQFSKNEGCDKMIFPQLKHSKIQLDGVKARLMKKCRDVNKTGTDLPFIPSDDIESDDISNKEDNESLDEKTNIETIINMNKNLHNEIDEDIESVNSNNDFNDF